MNPTISDPHDSHHPLSSRVICGWPPAIRERRRLFLQLVECDEAIRLLDQRADAVATKLDRIDDVDPRYGRLAHRLGVAIHALEDQRRLADEVRAELSREEAV